MARHTINRRRRVHASSGMAIQNLRIWATNDKPLYGYLVNFKVNARNRFGAYTGMQSHGALIRNGEVIKGLGFGY